MVKRLPTMWETQVRSLGQGRSPGEGNGNPLQYSCLENPMDRGAWWATIHGVTKSRTRLSDFCVCRWRGAPGIPQAPVSAWHWVPSLQTREEGGPSPSEVKVAQSCPTLCDPMDCSPSGSSVHGILQARILEWVAISFLRAYFCLNKFLLFFLNLPVSELFL